MKARHNRIPQISTLSAAIMTAMTTLSVHAETTTEQIQTLPTVDVTAAAPSVTVSSPKFTAPLVDTPQTVSVIPAEVFNQQGAKNLTDVLKNTPGISFNAGENGFASSSNNFSMRGFDSSGNIFIDGSRDSGSYTRDVFNVESVEVAKGPASDNGRGGPGGYVNLVTKTPQAHDAYSGTANYGFDATDADPRQRMTLDINKVLSEGMAARVNLLVEDSGVAGREFAEQNSWGVAPSLAFGLGTPTRVVFAYEHVEQRDRPDFGVPAHLIKGMMRYNPALSGASRDNFYGLATDFDDTTSSSALIRVEHDLADNLTLSNQTRRSVTKRYALFTLPLSVSGNSVTTQRAGYGRDNDALSNLTNLAASFETGSIKHNVATGLELSREKSDAKRYPNDTTLGNPGTTDIFNPNPYRPTATPALGLIPTQSSQVDIDTVAVYANDTLQFNPQWQLTAGLRAERYTVEISGDGIPASGYENTETSLTGKLGAVFKPASNGSIYAAVAVSDLPPGSLLSNSDISRTGGNGLPGLAGMNNDHAKVQRSIGYELGTKWEFLDQRLTTTAAVFETTRKNVAITGGAGTATLRGYGEQQVRGLEFGATGQITPAWAVFGGVVFLNSERKHSDELDRLRCEANPGDYYPNPHPVTGNAPTAADCSAPGATRTNGDELAFTPKVSASLWTTYTLPAGLTLGGGVQHVGDSFLGRPDDAERIIPNGIFGKLPDYTVFNLMASYAVSPQLNVRLNVDNVTNELYATSANWGGQRVDLGAPRSYLLSADFKF